MNWLFTLLFWVPLVFSCVVVLWLFYLTLVGKISSKAARRALIAVIVIYFLQIAVNITYFYFRLKGDEFGKYLLPPNSNYLYQAAWAMSSPSVWALAIGIGLVLILLLLRKIFHSEILDRSDFYILLLTIFLVGPSSVLVLVLVSFLLMICFLIGFSFKQKKVDYRAKLILSPFLLIVAFIILILNNFEFYFKFLEMLRLT
ncbi:MAG: hypothetical protein WCV58_01785 [Patescibacteria group bacterium]|jgi:hypothetical protein